MEIKRLNASFESNKLSLKISMACQKKFKQKKGSFPVKNEGPLRECLRIPREPLFEMIFSRGTEIKSKPLATRRCFLRKKREKLLINRCNFAGKKTTSALKLTLLCANL